jgi:hypothetical protein
VPDSAATAYLRVIAQDPEAVLAALRASYPDAAHAAEPDPTVPNRR